MTSALNIIGSSDPLQSHWLKRFVASLIDWVIFYAIGWMLSLFIFSAFVFGGGWYGPGVWIGGLLWVLYAFVLEMSNGATLGKQLMGLRVVTMDGQKITAQQAFIRNISKIFGAFWFLDWLIGFVMDGDPRQKFTDRVTGCTVVRTDAQAYAEEQFRQMGHAPGYQTPLYGTPQAASPPVYGAPMPQQQPMQQPVAQANPDPMAQQPVQQAPVAVAQPQTPQQPGGWPPPQQPQGPWPQHQWNQQGQLQPQARFCTNCGGQLVPRGDGHMTCVRCGAVY